MEHNDRRTDRLKALLESQKLAVLATHREGQPYGSLVSFVATEDMKQILFATTRSTRKYANLTADDRVAMVIDNREPLVVRSSAPGEDSTKASFASLHESYVNVRGIDSILDHVKKVWASLWSDAALIYRQELGLDVETSTMAIAIQEIVVGTCSSVAFGLNPNDPSQAVIESVHGLNQGLVDAAVEPDRWIVDREREEIIEHRPAAGERRLAPSRHGLSMESLPPELSQQPPLEPGQVLTVFRLTQSLEQLFGSPQDVEWTVSSRDSAP